MNASIGFISAKGGQGVTVTACSFAVTQSARHSVALIAGDDARACFGLPTLTDGPYEVKPGLHLFASEDEMRSSGQTFDYIVLDGQPGEQTYLVTRPCYIALRRAVDSDLSYDGIILIDEPGRALDERDVKRALGKPVVAVMQIDPAVARSVDAGLLQHRLPTGIMIPMKDVVADLLGPVEVDAAI